MNTNVLNNLTVMLIDDDEKTRIQLEQDLKAIGVNGAIHSYGIPEDAITFASNHQIDLFICDLIMPTLSGLTVLKKIRANPKYLTTPFILLTANNDRMAVVSGIKLGLSQYILKPWSKQSLMIKISECFDP